MLVANVEHRAYLNSFATSGADGPGQPLDRFPLSPSPSYTVCWLLYREVPFVLNRFAISGADPSYIVY